MVGLALARMRLRIGLIAAIRTIVGFRFVIEAQAFGGVDMHYDRVVNVFDLVQYFHQRVNVITLLHIAVVQAECFEQIQFGHAIRRTQLGKLPVHTAEILSDRHFVVVDDDDEITALFGRIVQPLERNGRTQDPSPIMAITLPIVLSPAAPRCISRVLARPQAEKSKCRYGRAQRNHVRFPADS